MQMFLFWTLDRYTVHDSYNGKVSKATKWLTTTSTRTPEPDPGSAPPCLASPRLAWQGGEQFTLTLSFTNVYERLKNEWMKLNKYLYCLSEWVSGSRGSNARTCCLSLLGNARQGVIWPSRVPSWYCSSSSWETLRSYFSMSHGRDSHSDAHIFCVRSWLFHWTLFYVLNIY